MGVITTEAARVGGPGLHALVIGVGEYTHTKDFNSLTSPVESAKAMSTWLLNNHRSSVTHLHSLEVLISGDPFIHNDDVSRVPTLENITDAVRRWRDRGDSHEGNQLILYFCGHGFAEGDKAKLLASDYGSDEETPEVDLVDFEGIVRGLESCKAQSQLFLIDTCRTPQDETLRGHLDKGRPILKLKPTDNTPEQAQLFATRLGQQAGGDPGQPSLFMQCFLTAVKGLACHYDNGKWHVGAISLLNGIARAMRLMAPDEDQRPAGQKMAENFSIHEPETPEVHVHVRCRPAEKADNSILRVWQSPQLKGPRGHLKATETFNGRDLAIVLPIGGYTFKVSPAMDLRRSKGTNWANVQPPHTEVNVECQ
ncbi:caspase family protein [Burkholderia sp. PU8-34]